jgi:hypothetical protein
MACFPATIAAVDHQHSHHFQPPEKPRQRGHSRGVEPHIRDPYSSHCRRPADRPGVLGRSSRGGNLGGRPVSVRLTPIYRPRLYRIAHDARFFVDGALSHQETRARAVIHLLLAFNNP